MTHVEVRGSEAWDSSIATFSPDAKEFIVVAHKGNLEKNTNDYSLLLFHSADAFHSPRPQVLLTLASTSNNAAISNVRWLADNKTVLFLGERPRKKLQIYSLKVNTRKLTRLTQHPTDILAFDATNDLRTLAYLARQPITNILDKTSRTLGLLISQQEFADLLIGHNSNEWFVSPLQLFLQRDGKGATEITFQNREMLVPHGGISLSPDGKFVVVRTNTRFYGNPESWKEYKTPFGDSQREFLTYRLIDTHNGSVRPLLDAPAQSGGLVWSADGKSVLVGATYLPLNIEDTAERELRKASTWTVEIFAGSGEFRRMTQGSYRVLKWDSSTDTVFLKPLNATAFSVDKNDNQVICFHKTGGQWEKADPATASAASSRAFEVREEQDINTPPRLFVVNQNTGKKVLLMDLNPQFQSIRFGHVEGITWKGTDGTYERGGLYLPTEYAPGRRYPLVIQTHGWNPEEFSIDGWATSGYAAQALAGKGAVVAQVPEAKELGTKLEGPQNMAMFEGLIDDLDKRGLVDRNRVGLLGFSRTGYAVRYTLAFSKYPIAAAVVADGMDGGYWEYIAESNLEGGPAYVYDGQNGAPPFGRGLHNWLENAPSFNLDRVHTPVRQLGFGRYWFQATWEWFVGLKRLGKPVELIWLPDAAHELVKPLERMTAQQGDVDWFCFWLKGEEESDPAKAGQYARWRELRKLHEADLQRQDNAK